MINLLTRNQTTVSGSEDQIMDGGSSARYFQRSSWLTTPNASRRWRHVFFDSESDGFDNLDSFYGESESNASFCRYRAESRSDINIDSGTDIDPMHAGLNQKKMKGMKKQNGKKRMLRNMQLGILRLELDTSNPNEANLPVLNYRRSRNGFEQLLDHLSS
ncbi:hypothetical protein V6N13_054978 [Hibiscus sabdariffa]|uniref:Uncharacterized protein n=1 Tax=Hibiscus sabdariffa TaxID=183260 RepID=A0ABR2DW63_9ROSI